MKYLILIYLIGFTACSSSPLFNKKHARHSYVMHDILGIEDDVAAYTPYQYSIAKKYALPKDYWLVQYCDSTFGIWHDSEIGLQCFLYYTRLKDHWQFGSNCKDRATRYVDSVDAKADFLSFTAPQNIPTGPPTADTCIVKQFKDTLAIEPHLDTAAIRIENEKPITHKKHKEVDISVPKYYWAPLAQPDTFLMANGDSIMYDPVNGWQIHGYFRIDTIKYLCNDSIINPIGVDSSGPPPRKDSIVILGNKDTLFFENHVPVRLSNHKKKRHIL